MVNDLAKQVSEMAKGTRYQGLFNLPPVKDSKYSGLMFAHQFSVEGRRHVSERPITHLFVRPRETGIPIRELKIYGTLDFGSLNGKDIIAFIVRADRTSDFQSSSDENGYKVTRSQGVVYTPRETFNRVEPSILTILLSEGGIEGFSHTHAAYNFFPNLRQE